MTLLNSKNLPLGGVMTRFELKDPSGKTHASDALFGPKGLLVAFTCNHCPYALAVWPRLIRLAQFARQEGVNTVAINPNIHPDYPEDAPGKMLEKIRAWNIPFPYLVDEAQAVARAFDAQCTPDLYLFDKDKKLSYHGRIDDNWQDEAKVTRQELKEAVTSLCRGGRVTTDQRPSMGCSIKWRE